MFHRLLHACVLVLGIGGLASAQRIAPVPKPTPVVANFKLASIEANQLARIVEARRKFGVTGKGLAAAVLDTGLRTSHMDFQQRVLPGRSFISGQGVSDGNGHGTNVSGIIAANHLHQGVAIDAKILPLKVLSNQGDGDFQAVRDALDYVIQNHASMNISVVNMSLGDGGNRTSTQLNQIHQKIQTLQSMNIPVVISAGNDFHTHGSKEGMGDPAAVAECISVGAVFDGDIGSRKWSSGAEVFESKLDCICPFSQRQKTGLPTDTDIFAPGASLQSAGHLEDNATSVMDGTSQAAPVVAGVILLMQEFYMDRKGALPPVSKVRSWLVASAADINDGDDEKDNVQNTGKQFVRVDAMNALQAIENELGPKSQQIRITGIRCNKKQEAFGRDEIQLAIFADGKKIPVSYPDKTSQTKIPIKRIRSNETWALDIPVTFKKGVTIEIWEIDKPPLDEHDCLGVTTIKKSGPNQQNHKFAAGAAQIRMHDYTVMWQ